MFNDAFPLFPPPPSHTPAGEGNMKLHCCVAAYVSDFALLGTALLPYPNHRAHFSASLDHAMWFHSTFRADEWMLYECESPWAGQCGRHFPLSCAAYVLFVEIHLNVFEMSACIYQNEDELFNRAMKQ